MTQDKGKLVHAHPANELTEKLFGFESTINKTKNANAAATALTISSDTVPAGKIWKITHITTWNEDGDIATGFKLSLYSNSAEVRLYFKVGTTARYETINMNVELYLNVDDFIRAVFDGVASPETCYLNIFGYEMNAP